MESLSRLLSCVESDERYHDLHRREPAQAFSVPTWSERERQADREREERKGYQLPVRPSPIKGYAQPQPRSVGLTERCWMEQSYFQVTREIPNT